MKNKVFDFDENKFPVQPRYIIGTDCIDEYSNAYCMMMLVNGESQIIMSKTIRDQKDFLEEVNNLSKYFNARVIDTEYK